MIIGLGLRLRVKAWFRGWVLVSWVSVLSIAILTPVQVGRQCAYSTINSVLSLGCLSIAELVHGFIVPRTCHSF